jgi:hypothetical protein
MFNDDHIKIYQQHNKLYETCFTLAANNKNFKGNIRCIST